MIKMRKIIAFLLVMISMAMSANDGVYYTSGNQLVPLKETNISVKKEVLTIWLQDDGMAKVDVYYEFNNPESTAKTVLMGFEADPSYNDDYTLYVDGKHPHIKDFTVEINGEKIGYKNAISDVTAFSPLDMKKWELDEYGLYLVRKDGTGQIDNYAYVYYFNATFKPGLNKIHHTYLYTMSASVSQAFSVPYKLSPAARWANGQIDDFTLYICAENTAKHFYVNAEALQDMMPRLEGPFTKVRPKTYYEQNMWEIALRNSKVKFHKKNYTPKPEQELSIGSADGDKVYESTARFGEFYDRSSTLCLALWKFTEDREQKLSDEMLQRIARNLPYANRGRIFKNKEIQKYMESLWWYMPDPNYNDDTSDFTSQDWEYIKYDPKNE